MPKKIIKPIVIFSFNVRSLLDPPPANDPASEMLVKRRNVGARRILCYFPKGFGQDAKGRARIGGREEERERGGLHYRD